MEKIDRYFRTVILEFPYFIYRIKRIFFLKGDRSVIERAKLKSDLGIKWNKKERIVMKKTLDATMKN